MTRTVLAGCAVALTLGRFAWSQVPLASEFRVNTYTTGDQDSPQLAVDGAGRFVVTWVSYPQDGSSYGVFARRFAVDATPLDAAEFVVSTETLGSQEPVAAASRRDGGFTVVWSTPEGSGRGIHGRLFDASGNPATDEFSVAASTTGRQFGPVICADATGGFVVAWTQFIDGPPNESEVFARRFDALGAALGNDFAVNSYTTGRQFADTLACRADGSFVIAWTYSEGQDGSASGLFAQRFDSAGQRVGAEFQINQYTTGTQGGGVIASDPAGNFVVVWRGFQQPDGDGFDIFGRRFDSDAAPLGPEFKVNDVTTGTQRYPTVTLDPRGNFVVAWNGPGPAQNYEVFGRTFDRVGPTSDEFALGTVVAGVRRAPFVVSTGDGDFLVAWVAADAPGSFGVFARQFRTDVIFRDGFEAGGLSAWSASATGAGALDVSPAAALDSTGTGLQGNVNDTTALYVQDDSPQDERRYRARFWIDPNGFDPGTTQGHLRTRVLIGFTDAPARRVVTVILRNESAVYSFMGRARLDDDTQADTGFFAVADGPHAVELDLVAASGPDSMDGSLEFFIDGVSQVQLTTLDNSLAAVDFARLGALSVKTGAAGTLYWDEFESRRASYIGP